MSFRQLEDTDKKIIRAIYKIGAKDGMSKVTAKRIAALCDISDCTVFNVFGTKRGYLDAAAQTFDRTHMDEVMRYANEGKDIYELWDIMLETFLSDPDGSMYYNRYTLEFGFDPTSRNPRADEFLLAAKAAFNAAAPLDDDTYLILWDYITSMAFYYAEKFIHGYLENSAQNKARVKSVVFGGLNALIG